MRASRPEYGSSRPKQSIQIKGDAMIVAKSQAGLMTQLCCGCAKADGGRAASLGAFRDLRIAPRKDALYEELLFMLGG